MVFFSVVIPVFNRANLIQITIDSILNQNIENYEIIIVDDGSTDHTIEILKEYGSKIKIFTQRNQGPGKARNIGIEHSQGEYIAFLDSDDLWFPWTLDVYAQIIKATNNPAFLAGQSIFFSNEHELEFVQIPARVHYRYYQNLYASSKDVTSFLTSSVVIRRDTLQQLGGFTDQWINSEDNDLWLRLGTVEGFVYIDSPYVLAYRQHSYSAMSIATKTYDGTCYLIQQEKQNQYPGGKIREKERLEILTRHIRPVSLNCLHENEVHKGWQLYKETFLWHLVLGRFRYLIGFLWLICVSIISYRRQ
ncbi:glycosyltransferase family 2 protein [Trichormus azollae]|uniref:glycosyltransferase family 2 protein n=1 Tax=Trichormus azollae TaxID=1164 RepID=UPI00325CE3E0